MLKFTLVDFAFGIIITTAAAMAAGAGHGSYAPLAVVSAPLAFGGIRLAVFGTPFLWAAIGFLSGRSYISGNRKLSVGASALQYAAAAILAFWKRSDDFSDLDLVHRVPGPVIVVGFLYVIGQTIFWIIAFRPANSVQSSVG